MRFFWNTALKDLLRHRRNPLEFGIWLGIPLLIGGLIILAFGGRSGPAPQIHMLVADEDDSFLSGLLVGALSQEELGGMIRAEEVTTDSGRERMDKGEASALLIIPENFATAVLKEEPITLQLVTNPAENILPGIVEETLSIVVDGTFYLHRLLGDELKTMAEGPPDGQTTFPDAAVAYMSVRINQIIGHLVNYFDPLVINLVEEAPLSAEDEEDDLNLGILFVPSILMMGLIFISRVPGEDLWQEREQHTLRRVVVTPQNLVAFLAGKVLAGTVLVAIISMVGLAVGYGYFRLSPLTWPLAVVWSTAAGTMLMALMLLIQIFAASQKAAGIVTLTLVFPLMMLGGSFFPFEAMPSWMVTVGQLTPNGWALQGLKQIIMQDFTLQSVYTGFGIMTVIVVLAFVVSAYRLRHGFAQG